MCYNPTIAELNIAADGKKTMVFRESKRKTKEWQNGMPLMAGDIYPDKKAFRAYPKTLQKLMRKKRIVYKADVRIACRNCEICLERKSKEWALRAIHESSLYRHKDGTSKNIAVTLSMRNEEVQKRDGKISRRDMQLFLKRLRKHKAMTGDTIRVMYSGEYGDKTKRPHYHAILFNCDFEDKVFEKKTGAGTKLYRSKTLEQIWGLGHVWIGEVTYKSAAYIARYTFKKLGKITTNLPTKEFIQASNRPGLARDWLDLYGLTDIYACQLARLQKPQVIPKYYDDWLKKKHEEIYNQIKKYRCETINPNHPDKTYERLQDARRIKQMQFKKLVRGTVPIAEA